VGIGTSSPLSPLDVVVGAGGARRILLNYDDSLITIKGASNTANPETLRLVADNIRFNTGITGSGTEHMRLDSSGNLGIGTSSPGVKLDVIGQSRLIYNTGATNTGDQNVATVGVTTTGAYASSYGAGLQFQITNSSGGYSGSRIVSRLNADNNTANLVFQARNYGFADSMTLDASGNLGVGETSLTERITARKDGTGAYATIQVKNTNSTATLNVGVGGSAVANSALQNNAYLINAGSSDLVFGTADTERARITGGGGDLLVGTTNAAQGAGVGNKFIGTGAVWVVNAATSDGFSYYNSSASAYRFYVSSGGTISATNTTISAISDQRFKENIQNLDVGLDKIMALKPRKFDWKAGKGKDIKGDRGFIAQEFEQVFPDLIDEWKDPAPEGEEPYKSVRQDLIPVLVKAIQELKAELDSVKAELATLKGQP
jgi:hypothetical protein